MSNELKQKIGLQRQRNYLARDFEDFRYNLLRHAQSYFGDKIQDWSEASTGGLFLDMAAYIGDNMSFYLDHQFRELDPDTAVENVNIEAMIKQSGLKITGNSPASVNVKFYITVPVTQSLNSNGVASPDENYIPIIKEGCELIGADQITFYLSHNVDFALKDENGEYVATVHPIIENNVITEYVFVAEGNCVSGEIATETVSFGDFEQFRTYTLSNPHVTSIMYMYDTDGNEYHEVESLSQDTIFRNVLGVDGQNYLEVETTSYRYTTSTDISMRMTTIQFGSGNSELVVENDNFSNMALPLYGKKTFSSFSLDPNQLLKNNTLGISPSNTTLTIVYRHGGGQNHNLPANSLNRIESIEWVFPTNAIFSAASNVRESVSISQDNEATGGASAPNVDQLKDLVKTARTMQNRVVTKKDLLARLYTMPTEFGVIYRANIVPNPENALSSILYVCSKNKYGDLTECSDALKRNISTYINEFRLIGDAIDILDAKIINYQIKITINISDNMNVNSTVATVIRNITKLLNLERASLGKSINLTNIQRMIINIPGVKSIGDIKCVNVSGIANENEYSSNYKNMDLVLKNGVYYAEPYEIFELKFPKDDIIISVE